MTDLDRITSITKESLRANLARTGSRAFAAFQHGMDMNLLLLSGSMLANEKDFSELKAKIRFAPSESHALSFERAKFESQRWLLKNSLQDSLRVATAILEDVRTICSLVAHLDKEGAELQSALKEATGKSRTAFLKLPLVARLDRLKEDFQIECPQRDSLISLLKVVKCLQSHAGIVTKSDADNGAELAVHLFGITVTSKELIERDGNHSDLQKSSQLQLKQGTKLIPVGQAIEFSRGEHMATILSLCILTSSLLQEADKFIQSADSPEVLSR